MRIKATILTGLMVMGGGIFLSGIFNPAMAAPPNCETEVSKRCKNTDEEDSGGNLVAKFCLEITAGSYGFEGDYLGSDGGKYCDRNKKDKVMVFTGKGPGFRFDTNKGKSAAARNVQINFENGGITVEDTDGLEHIYDSGLYEIDFRFDLDSGGLDLGGISNSYSATVPVGIRIQALDGNELGLLGYGNADHLFSDPSLDTECMKDETANVLVTRTAVATWTIESDPSNSTACLWVGHARFTGQDGTPIEEMPFNFTITIDP